MSEFGASVVCCLFVAEGEILPPHSRKQPPLQKKDVLPEKKQNSSHPTATGAPAIASDEINEHSEGKYQSSEKQ